MKKIYLDCAATTPVDKRVLEAMLPYFGSPPAGGYGNAGSLHSFGREAIAAIDSARNDVAKAIGAEYGDVIFAGSATEANNLVLRGVLKTGNRKSKPKIIVSAIEHESVLETARDLGKEGVEVVILPVNGEGFVDLEKFKSSLDERIVLVSVMYANNEIGTIQPIAEISKIVKEFNYKIFFHTDAVQVFQYLDCNVNVLGVDFLTLSAHKIYGPKGVGALFIRNRQSAAHNLKPVITGGGQEFGLRSGTENVPSIVGFAKAVELVNHSRESENGRVAKLRDYFFEEIRKIYPPSLRNGGEPALPNILNVYFPGHRAEDLLVKFDRAGIAVSAGSACQSRAARPSHVLQALGFPEERVKSSIRFSFGRPTTDSEIKTVLKRVEEMKILA
ncbi:MAG: cysteine desulfurase family protein [Candidatus Jorgensenbacteria bacterium]